MTNNEIREMRIQTNWMDNEGKAWAEESLTLLPKMYLNGIGITEMAYTLKRSEMAVIQKINVMELNTLTKKTRMKKDKKVECKCNECLLHEECELYKTKCILMEAHNSTSIP